MIVILLAEGFEEIEALTPADMLRRAGEDVRLVGVSGRTITGSHGIAVNCDMTIDELVVEDIDMAIFPGGMPGSLNLDADPSTDLIINGLKEKGAHIAAICAAPLILGKRGLLEGKMAVCYPGFEGMLLGATLSDSSVVTDGNITTAKGMGVALEFAKELVRIASGKEKAEELKASIMEYNPSSKAPAVKIVPTTPKLVTCERVERDYTDYKLPEASILTEYERAADDGADIEIQNYADKILEALSSFDVTASIRGVDRGPRITRFELVPAKGTKVTKITNLRDDIALMMGVGDIRMEAPIPGKSAVGIEVPNAKSSIVGLGELLTSDEFVANQSKTAVAIGVDICGAPIVGDIARMPHAIVSGATGMGKSVLINSMLVSMLCKAKPDEVKLILIDPKQVEFTPYKGIPHLLVPVVTDIRDAVGALGYAVSEMERRYSLIASAEVRNIDSYNAEVEKNPALGKKLPKIVIVIDELADLMLQARDPVENLIMCLAQKSRAAGIHLIIGTQRPSVNVITGVIKANIPTRICCKVASVIDSRTVIEMSGAERLLNRGDMLYMSPTAMNPIRVQGAFVSDADICKLADYLKAQSGEDYDASVMAEIALRGAGEYEQEEPEEDALEEMLKDIQFLDAVRIAMENGQASTSLLQRKMSIGYGKAARFIDAMCDLGFISEHNDHKPRRVLITEEKLESIINKYRA